MAEAAIGVSGARGHAPSGAGAAKLGIGVEHRLARNVPNVSTRFGISWVSGLVSCEIGYSMGRPVTVGTQTIWGKPPARGRQRAKRTVVFFLTYYFKTLGYRRPPWDQITRFLFLCRLVPQKTTAKEVGTWWSTVLTRHRRQHGDARTAGACPTGASPAVPGLQGDGLVISCPSRRPADLSAS